MNPTDDEVLARVRASLHATADRTPIGDGRLDELTIHRLGKDRRTLVAAFSAAAAVAVIAGTGVVLAGVGTHGSDSVGTVSGGLPAPTAACTPQNYYVIASASELAGMTYLLPSPPSGYQMYGAWGTIDRSLCPGTTNWYVEYDKAVDAHDTVAIQLQVTTAAARTKNGQALGGEPGDLAPTLAPQPVPSVSGPAVSAVASLGPAGPAAQGAEPGATWQTVTVDGHSGKFLGAKSGTGTLVWTDGALLFQLDAPIAGGDPAEIVTLAESLVRVLPTDPRIKPPTNCDVPAGAVCSDGRG